MRLKKLADGVVLSLARASGVVLQRSGHAGFFGPHDLLHYAVETTLGAREGFLGLMASGWGFEAFTDREDPRYKAMPREAVWIESFVDVMGRAYREPAWRDPELRAVWLEDVRAEITMQAGRVGWDGPVATDEQIVAICEAYSELIGRWARTPVGGHMEVVFEVGG